MSGNRSSFLLFMLANLAVAYAPGVFWLPGLPGEGASPWLVPLSPILLVMLYLDMDKTLACCLGLMIFLLLIGALRQLFKRIHLRIVSPLVLLINRKPNP